MALFWVVAPCSLVEVTSVSEVLAAFIALMMEATRTSETLVNFYHGATTQKTAIFLLQGVYLFAT
jgi:hypothetical protein